RLRRHDAHPASPPRVSVSLDSRLRGDERWRRTAPYSSLAPLALMGPAHRSISLGTNFVRWFGVLRFGGGTVTPIDLNRSLTAGVSTAAFTAWARRCTTSRGVPLGKDSEAQLPQSRPPSPCSCAVASCSRPGARSSPSVAMAFTVPDWICGSALEICSATKSTRPPIRSCIAGAEPRRAAGVLDHDLLAEDFAQARREDPPQRVDRPARGVRHDHGHRPVRPILRVRRRGQCQQEREYGGSNRFFHSFLPPNKGIAP